MTREVPAFPGPGCSAPGTCLAQWSRRRLATGGLRFDAGRFFTGSPGHRITGSPGHRASPLRLPAVSSAVCCRSREASRRPPLRSPTAACQRSAAAARPALPASTGATAGRWCAPCHDPVCPSPEFARKGSLCMLWVRCGAVSYGAVRAMSSGAMRCDFQNPKP